VDQQRKASKKCLIACEVSDHRFERGRLLDILVDGHHLFLWRAVSCYQSEAMSMIECGFFFDVYGLCPND
jgi:hypothetical protein